MSNEPSDLELIGITQTTGTRSPVHSDAVAALLERHTAYLAAQHRQAGIDPADLTSIVSTAIWTAARSFDPSAGATFSTWASTIVKRRVIDQTRKDHRRKAAHQRHADQQKAERGFDHPDHLGELVAQQQAEQLAKTLTATELAVFKLRFAGKSLADIAQALGRGVKAVDNASQRIRNKFADLLAGVANA